MRKDVPRPEKRQIESSKEHAREQETKGAFEEEEPAPSGWREAERPVHTVSHLKPDDGRNAPLPNKFNEI